MAESSSEEYKGIVKHVAELTERVQLLERAQFVSLDPQKFNVMLIRLPDDSTSADVQHFEHIAAGLREWGNINCMVIMPSSCEVTFAQEVKPEE